MDHIFALPLFGAALHAEKCIESILRQSGDPVRVILGTSTPSDALARVSEKYGLELHVNPDRRDIATDWNYVLNLAQAQYVTIAHQDDVYDYEYLAKMRQVALSHADLVVAFSDYREHADAGPRPPNMNLRIKRRLCRRAFKSAAVIRARAEKMRLLHLGNPVCCPTVMLHRAKVPEFLFSSDYKTNLDWDAWLRLADVPGAFAYVRDTLVSKGIHSQSETTVTIANRTRKREDLKMFRRFWPAPVARAIAEVYSLGYRANRVRV